MNAHIEKREIFQYQIHADVARLMHVNIKVAAIDGHTCMYVRNYYLRKKKHRAVLSVIFIYSNCKKMSLYTEKY